MAQNDWQRKKQANTMLTAQSIYAEMIEAMRQEVVAHKDNVITAFVQEQTGSTIVDVTEIAKRGYLAQAEDTSEVFHWDGHPRIYFAPVEMQKVNGTLRPVLKYQRIPLPAEPEADYVATECNCVEYKNQEGERPTPVFVAFQERDHAWPYETEPIADVLGHDRPVIYHQPMTWEQFDQVKGRIEAGETVTEATINVLGATEE
jgi:hypothetical protein